MLRRVIAAAAIGMVMTATGASATVISGTWSFEVDQWPISNEPRIPSPPVIASETFSFDTNTSSSNPLPANGFTSNIPLTPGSYVYSQSTDSLLLLFSGTGFFIEAIYIDVATHLFEPSVLPILQHVLFIPSLNESLDANTFSGGFTATPLPAALPLFVTGLGALSLLGWRRKRKTQLTPAEASA